MACCNVIAMKSNLYLKWNYFLYTMYWIYVIKSVFHCIFRETGCHNLVLIFMAIIIPTVTHRDMDNTHDIALETCTLRPLSTQSQVTIIRWHNLPNGHPTTLSSTPPLTLILVFQLKEGLISTLMHQCLSLGHGLVMYLQAIPISY
jgi:hypothetical protein